MRLRTFFHAEEASSAEFQGAAAAVIDVVRATSSVIEALANGARAIYPTVSTEDAIRLANSLGREDTLLCGERRGLKIEGFDLGNSPREFSRDRVEGKRLVMSTTNGTRAFVAAQGADRILATSFSNLGAVARTLREHDDVVLICAGKEDRFSLDDALCAGTLLQAVLGADGGAETGLDDASRAVLALASDFEIDADLLRNTAAGAALEAVGLGDDLPICAEVDRHDLVPEMSDRMIRLPGRGG